VGGVFGDRGHPFVWRLFVRRKICKAQHWDQKPVFQDPPSFEIHPTPPHCYLHFVLPAFPHEAKSDRYTNQDERKNRKIHEPLASDSGLALFSDSIPIHRFSWQRPALWNGQIRAFHSAKRNSREISVCFWIFFLIFGISSAACVILSYRDRG